MEITIDTERDDIAKAIRMLQALRGDSRAVTVSGINPGPTFNGDKVKEAVQGRAEAEEHLGATVELAPDPVFTDEEIKESEELTRKESGEDVAALFVDLGDKTDDVPAPDAELDKRGIPWDERIHASTQTKTANGAWKNKRGVDSDYRAKVELELLGEGSSGVTTSPSTPASASTPPPPPPPPPVPAPPTSEPMTFAQFIKAVTSNNIDQDALNTACETCGVQNFMMLNKQPEKIADVIKELGL